MPVALLAAMLAQSPATGPAPKPPTGKWTVEYEPSQCILQRDYGTADRPMALAFRMWPMAVRVDLVLILPAADYPLSSEGKAQITIDPAKPLTDQIFLSWQPKGKNVRVVDISIPKDAAEAARQAGAISLAFPRDIRVNLKLAGTVKAFAAIKACEVDLLKQWQIDPSERDNIAQEAKPLGSPLDWFNEKDYPPIAKSSDLSALVTIFYEIGIDGRIASCRPLGPARPADFDAKTCALMAKNGRFRPAIDKAGHPTVSHQINNIRWILDER